MSLVRQPEPPVHGHFSDGTFHSCAILFTKKDNQPTNHFFTFKLRTILSTEFGGDPSELAKSVICCVPTQRIPDYSVSPHTEHDVVLSDRSVSGARIGSEPNDPGDDQWQRLL